MIFINIFIKSNGYNNNFKDEDNLKGTSQQYNIGNEQQQNVKKELNYIKKS